MSRSAGSGNRPAGRSAPSLRARLLRVVGSSSISHGYSLTLWVTGAAIGDVNDVMPTAADAFALGVGGCFAFLVTGVAASHRHRYVLDNPAGVVTRLWSVVHVASVAVCCAVAWTVHNVMHGALAFGTIGFLLTTVYLWLAAIQLWLADRWAPIPSAVDHAR